MPEYNYGKHLRTLMSIESDGMIFKNNQLQILNFQVSSQSQIEAIAADLKNGIYGLIATNVIILSFHGSDGTITLGVFIYSFF